MNIKVEVRIVCQMPSRFEHAARHGGKCNRTVVSDSLDKATAEMRKHYDEMHPEVDP